MLSNIVFQSTPTGFSHFRWLVYDTTISWSYRYTFVHAKFSYKFVVCVNNTSSCK